MPRRTYYDWNIHAQVPYDRNVMFALAVYKIMIIQNNFGIETAAERCLVSVKGNKCPHGHLERCKACRATEVGQVDDEAGRENARAE